MPNGNREVIEIEHRRLVTQDELETAIQGCEDVFWAKALEYFPEVTTGDTEPGATMTYSTTVENFLKRWLTGNSKLTIGGLTEDDASELLEEMADHYVCATCTILKDGDELTEWRYLNERIRLTIVELAMAGSFQGYALLVTDTTNDDQTIGTSFHEVKELVDRTVTDIEQREQ